MDEENALCTRACGNPCALVGVGDALQRVQIHRSRLLGDQSLYGVFNTGNFPREPLLRLLRTAMLMVGGGIQVKWRSTLKFNSQRH